MNLSQSFAVLALTVLGGAPAPAQQAPGDDELEALSVEELLELSRRVEGILRARLTPAEAGEHGIPLRSHDYAATELGGLHWRELAHLADDLAELIEGRLLAPPPSIEREWQGRLPGPHAGVVRLLPPNVYIGRLQGDDDASGYSFQTRTHGTANVDVRWRGASLTTGLDATTVGWLLDVGDVPLEALAAPVAAEDGEQQATAEAFLWRRHAGMPTGNRQQFDTWKSRLVQEAQQLSLGAAAGVTPGRTYLLRSLRLDGHDLLVGLRIVRQDDVGLVLAWRRLARFPVAVAPGGGGAWSVHRTRREIHYPARLQGVATASLLELQADVQEAGRAVLLRPDPALEAEYAELLAAEDYGLVKLLGQGDFARLTGLTGGGSSIGFADLSRDKRRADLSLSVPDGSVRGTEYLQVASDNGGAGYLFDLGAYPLELLEGRDKLPDAFTRQERSNWSQALRNGNLSSAARRSTRVAARSGHTYVLRFQVENGRDHLVALRVVGTDETGVTLLFKRLKTFREASG
jgi:hypothetical protein